MLVRVRQLSPLLDSGLLAGTDGQAVGRDAVSGQVTSTTLGQVVTGHGYNGFGEPATFTAETGGVGLYEVAYARDGLGRITHKTETVDGHTVVHGYGYDARGRLEEVTRDGTLAAAYAYDPNGNRLSKTTPAGSVAAGYDAQDRLTAYGDAAYTWTANGELATKTTPEGTTAYTYDELGNLTTVDLPDGATVVYTADGLGRRTSTTVDGQTSQRLAYGAGPHPVAEVDAAGTPTTVFAYGTLPHVPDYLIRDGDTYRIVTDQLGSVRLVVDTATGQIVQRIDYDEFGAVLADTNPGFQPFGYAGGLYDPATGLVRFGARDYDPHTGRWTAKDPIGFNGGDTNLYAYVGNDPINHIDPDGTSKVKAAATGVAVVASGVALVAGVAAVAAPGVLVAGVAAGTIAIGATVVSVVAQGVVTVSECRAEVGFSCAANAAALLLAATGGGVAAHVGPAAAAAVSGATFGAGLTVAFRKKTGHRLHECPQDREFFDRRLYGYA